MEMRSNKNIRIGDVLKEFGYVTDDDIGAALEYTKTHEGVRLGGALIEMNIITEKQMLEALGRRLQYDVVNIADLAVDINAVETIPQPLAEKYGMMAYRIEDGVLYLLTNDPLNFYGLEDIRQVTGADLKIELTEKQPLDNAIQYYYSEVSAKKAADKAAKSSLAEDDIIEVNVEDADDDTPIINLLNSLVVRAYNSNVSDIHIEPQIDSVRVRFRIDGQLFVMANIGKEKQAQIIGRLKAISNI